MVFGWTRLLGNFGMTAIAGEKPPSLSTNQTDANIVLPAKLSNIKKAEEFASQKLKWNSSEEVLSILISFDKHEAWFSKEVTSRPPNGSMFLFNKQKVKDYRKDGYTWKKRTSSSSYIREDHCKLKVYGVNCLNVLYTHSAIISTFHRRIYWLLQNPEIVLVHYLNLIEEDLTEQVTYAREQKKSNITCQIKSIFSGVSEHLIPNFEITEEDETSSTTSQQKKTVNSKKLFRIAITPADPTPLPPTQPTQPTPTPTLTTATTSELTNCNQSYQVNLWIRANNGTSTLAHLPLQANHSSLGNLGNSNLGNRQCDINFVQSQPTPRSSPRTIQSTVLLTPVCNVSSRNSPVEPTNSNVSLAQQNVQLPASSSVTSSLNVPIGYQNTALSSESQIVESRRVLGTRDSRNNDQGDRENGENDNLSTNTNTRPTYASPGGVAKPPLLFFSSSSIPAAVRSASTLNLPQTDENSVSGMNCSDGPTLVNNSTCVSTFCNATLMNTMCSIDQRKEDSSSPMDFQFRPMSLPLEDQAPIEQQQSRSFQNTGHVTVSESNSKHTGHDSSHGIPASSDGNNSVSGKTSETHPHSSTNPHSVSADLSSSPSSDYGSLLSESGTRFSGSESLSSELGSGSTGHESAFDGPFRLPAPVTTMHKNQNPSCLGFNSIFSSSHNMHAQPQQDDVYQYSRGTSTPLDSNHVDMSFELPELNTFDELDYGTWSDDFSSVLGDYFNNSEPVGDNSIEVRDTIAQLEQRIEQSKEENLAHSNISSPNATDAGVFSNKSQKERIYNADQTGSKSGEFRPNTDQTQTTDTLTLPSTLAVSASVTCLPALNDVAMETHDSSQNVGYHSDDTSFSNSSQTERPLNLLASNNEANVEDSQDASTRSSNHERQPCASETSTATGMTVMPGSACITDFSPDWSYPEGGVKVLVTGEWSSYDVLYTCLFDGCSVEATLVQVGVLRCYCPPHEPGLVTLQVARNGFIVSNACVFEYRAHDTPGDLSTRHEWLTMDDGRFKLALLDRLERLESRLGLQAQNSNPAQSNRGQEQRRTFEERIMSTCRTLFQAKFSNGADLNRPYRGMTLLHLAAALGFSKLVRQMTTKWRDPETIELIRQELDPSRKDEFNCTPLMWACALGHRAAVAELLCCHDNALFVPDACGRLPLQVARDRRYFEVVDCIEEHMTTSPESEEEEDPLESYVSSPSTVNTPGACGTGQYNSPSLPLNSQPMSVENPYTDRACSPMHVEEVSNGGVLLSQALVQIHEMINEAERQADLENSQLQGISTRVAMPLSPVQEETPLLTSPGGWGSSGGRLRSFSSASSQSSPLTPSSKSSLSPGSPAFLNSPHSSPGVPPDTKEFHEFLCSSKKLLEKNFSELTLTDREQQELYQAALIIQEAYRSYKIRRQQRDQEMQAALLIQNHYRKYKQFVLYKKMTHAALIIQNQYRAYREHEQFKKSRRAAAIIQNQFRIYRRRRQWQKRRDEHKSKQQEARFMRQSSNRSNTSL